MSKMGRYELLEKLGEGGMGAVWLGRLSGEGGFQKLCIIKTVLPAIAKDQQFVSRFLHEGRVLTQLQHSNIAQVFDMGREGDTLYLALEYVPGVDLSNLSQHLRNQQQTFPLPVAVYLIQQVAEGLGFAHRKAANDGSPLAIVHRDVSPQNVMISFEGEVKVIDFGIAKSEGRSHATANASVMGKLGYMAPEQARGEPVDARADQYACGVLLWELLTSASFVPRGTMTEMVVAMANPAIRPLSPLRPEVPASLEAVVLKALAPMREARYETTDDLAAALTQELLNLGGLPTKRQVGEWVRANCPADFQANQALLTRVSSTKETVADDAGTFIRTPSIDRPVAPPESTAELAKLAGAGSKLPMIIAMGLGLAVLVGALIFLTVARPSRAVGGAVSKRVAARHSVEVFDDGEKTFIRAGTDSGLEVGESVALVGPDDGEATRAVIGQATVLEVFEDMARVHLGDVKQRPLFAVVRPGRAGGRARPGAEGSQGATSTGEGAHPSEGAPPKGVSNSAQEGQQAGEQPSSGASPGGGTTGAGAGPRGGAQPSEGASPKGGSDSAGEGSEAGSHSSGDAAPHGGTTAAGEESPHRSPNAGASPGPGAAGDARPALKVVGRVSPPPNAQFIFTSREPAALTGCSVTIANHRVAHVPTARWSPGTSVELAGNHFKASPGAPDVAHRTAHVVCAEGEATVRFQ